MRKVEMACIVDDDKIYVYGVRRLFEIYSICDKVLVFNNGQEAIDYLRKVADVPEDLPDVILLDINMPVMDGWDFLDEYKKLKSSITKDITIHMVSSSIHSDDVDRAKSYEEVSGYFTKPVMQEDFKKIFKS